MNIPSNIQCYQHLIGTVWIEDEILCLKSHRYSRTKDVIDDFISFVQGIIETPAYALADISNASPMDAGTRDYSSSETGRIYKALAIISTTYSGGEIGRSFINMNTSYPVRMFDNKMEAKRWLIAQMKLQLT
jgi:hypothetical protein